MKKKIIFGVIISSLMLLTACSDEKGDKDKEKLTYNEGLEVVLPEKEEILKGHIVYKDKNILYVSNKDTMIKVGVRIDDMQNLSEDEINQKMLEYVEGEAINVKTNTYTDGIVKEMYVESGDIEMIEPKKIPNAKLTIEEAYNQAVAYAYTTYDIEDLALITFTDYQYYKDEALWVITITIKEKNSETQSSLDIKVYDFDNNF